MTDKKLRADAERYVEEWKKTSPFARNIWGPGLRDVVAHALERDRAEQKLKCIDTCPNKIIFEEHGPYEATDTAEDKQETASNETCNQEILRCHVTGNPVGTDTWMKGKGCQCPACKPDIVEAGLMRMAEYNIKIECRGGGWLFSISPPNWPGPGTGITKGYFDTPSEAIRRALDEI